MNKTKKKLVGFLFLFLLFASPCLSATLYVDGSLGGDCAGGAGTSYQIASRNCNGSDGTKAYKLLQDGMQAASTTNKTVYVRTGTYSHIGDWTVNYNNGTAANRITIEACHDGSDGDCSDSDDAESVTIEQSDSQTFFIKLEVDYWTFAYFTFDFYYVGIGIRAADFAIIEHNTFIMHVGATGDNAGCVRSNYEGNPKSPIIRFNHMYNTTPRASQHGNCSGIHSYGWNVDYPAQWKNNVIHNFQKCVYWKKMNNAPHAEMEMAYNYLYDCGTALNFKGHNANVHDNIIVGSVIIDEEDDGGGGYSGDDNTFNHNTFYGAVGISEDADTNTFTNNIWTSQMNYANGVGTANPLHDYNLGPSSSSYVKNNGSNRTLSQWQDDLGNSCPSASDNDCNSISGSPTFVGGASPTTIAGFALTSESLGYQDGSDSKDRGADTALVGTDISGGVENTDALCSNSQDDDSDTLIDALDPDCNGHSCGAGTCEYGTELTCDDDFDNDGKGDGIDCLDADCLKTPADACAQKPLGYGGGAGHGGS